MDPTAEYPLLSVTIMAHPERKQYALDLSHQLDAPIVWDAINDRWDTGRRALLAHTHTGSKWALVVQDDAIVPGGFRVAVEKAMLNVPHPSPLVLYMTRTSQWAPVLDRIPRDLSYLIMNRIWWGVGVVIPTDIIEELVGYCDYMPGKQYDHRLGEAFYQLGIPVWYTWPNLLDHRPIKSLVPGRSSRRRAYWPVKGDASRLTWDGDMMVVDPPESAYQALQ